MKQYLRNIVKKLGLLPSLELAVRIFSAHYLIECWTGLKYYLYNYSITYFPNNRFRIFYLKQVLGISFGKECFVHMGCFFEGNNIVIGDNTVLGRNCYLGGSGGKLTIKNNVSITAQTYIFCSTHQKDSSTFKCVYRDVTIEDYVWIGARAMILPGVKMGKGSILGASSTATKNISSYSVFAGTPAREIGKRNKKLRYTLKYFPPFK